MQTLSVMHPREPSRPGPARTVADGMTRARLAHPVIERAPQAAALT